TRIKAQYKNRLQLTSYEDENTPIFFIAHDNGNFGIVDLNNKIILPIKYGGILRTAFKDIIEIETAQGYQLFSLRSKRIITSFYDENSKSDSNYLYLHKEPFVTPFDPRKEQTLLPWEYKRVQNIEGSDNFIAQKEGRYGVVNSRNEALVPFIYDNIKSTLKPNMLIIEKERKYGIIDTSNKLLYGMTDNAIESRRNYFEIKDYSKPLNPRLDYELKPIPDPR
ncbi:MAG: WG repeat-containing protein, partial [Segatella sp.]